MDISFLVYNSVIFSVFLLLFDKIKPNFNLYRIIIPIILCYVVIIASIRFHVGRDFNQYFELFYDLTFSDGISLSYTLLNIILRNISESPQVLFFSVSLIIYYFIFKTYKNYHSIIVILVWFLLLFFSSLNQLRQGISMSILMYSIFFINKNKVKYYLYVLLAFSFHMTGIFGFIYPFLSKVRVPYKKVVVLLSPLLLFVNLPQLLDASGIFNGSYYEFYIKDPIVYAAQQPLSFGGVFRLALPMMFIFYFRTSTDREINLINNSMMMYIIFYFLSLNFYILYRIYSLFLIFIPISCFYMYTYKKNMRWFVILYIIGCFLIYQKSIFEQTIDPINGNAIYPYQTIFDDVIIETPDYRE